ncbi:hypothetical protein P280DRAFT_447650 [Massarina eburnea CBS 473.64]|uniref:Uncharacterized protein n=1 Tax=Massarina eburnea CBS 473.64 TaxID=1395130 RepID=A0A6A6S3E8_9PLEO|nr:hypothetical protein P280DRAFT_447650 [Massarina eburnea CBS 473.64]
MLLTVPLDYNNTAVGTTDIAFIKWTAPPSDTSYSNPAQDILINPGGPGISGVRELLIAIDRLKNAGGAQNNYVGFDPRGVNNSGPDLSCFTGRHHTKLLYEQGLNLPTSVHNENSLIESWGKAGAFGEWCSKVHSADNSTAKYANTVAVANDMRHYTELLAESKGEDPSKSQLWYWGVSYGTILGSTFASLFPNRIGRMILDGIVDAEDYYSGKLQNSMEDVDAVLDTFFPYCYDAGAVNCALWEPSPEAIKARFHSVVDNLKTNPATVATPGFSDFPSILTYKILQATLLGALYTPDIYYPIIASGLVALESGHAELIASSTGTGIRSESCDPDAQLPIVEDMEPPVFIMCNDANGRFLLNEYEDWVDHAKYLYNQSHYFGEAWSFLRLICRKLDIRGPPSQIFTGVPSAANTSQPILFVSNKIDPVTPLSAAKRMRANFGGAGLLVQNAAGHTSGSTMSRCTFGYFAKYFEDGTLPPEGKICEPDHLPFQDGTVDVMSRVGLGSALLDGWRV